MPHLLPCTFFDRLSGRCRVLMCSTTSRVDVNLTSYLLLTLGVTQAREGTPVVCLERARELLAAARVSDFMRLT